MFKTLELPGGFALLASPTGLCPGPTGGRLRPPDPSPNNFAPPISNSWLRPWSPNKKGTSFNHSPIVPTAILNTCHAQQALNEVLLFGKNKRRKGQKERVREVHLMFRIFLNFKMVCIFGLSTPIVSIKYKDLKLCFRLVATFCIRITLQLNHFIAFLNTDKRRVAFIH